MTTDYPALEAYKRATAFGQPHRLKNAVIELADAMKDEYEDRIKALEANVTYWMEQAEDQVELIQRVKALEAELEIERGRLAACGVAALGYFDDCKDEYRSASLDDVLKLKAELAVERQKRCGTCGLGGECAVESVLIGVWVGPDREKRWCSFWQSAEQGTDNG